MTELIWDWLTLKAAYPSCHAKPPRPISFIHFEEMPFSVWTALAKGMTGGKREQHVRVIRDAADGDNANGPIPSYLSHVSPKARLEFLRDHVAADSSC